MARRFFALLCILPALAADWPRFRGPNGSGISPDTVPVEWSESKNVRWKTELPGKGNSSPIVVGKNVFVQTATGDGSKRSLVCLEADTGRVVWSKTIPGEPAKIHAKSSLASGTPVSDGERVVVTIWDGRGMSVHAFSLAGEVLWSTPLGAFKSQHGAGHSPILHAGKVFVNFDQDDAAEVVALDAKTGAKAWSQSRKAYRACYSTPILREKDDGKAELLVFSTAGATAYDPATGAVIWTWAIAWKDGEMALRSVASPVLAGNTFVCLNGDGSGARYSAAVEMTATDAKPRWEKRSSKLAPYVPCPVIQGGYVYWITDQGIAECVELTTGNVQWSERVLNSAVSASPVVAGNRFIAIDEKGQAVVVKVDPKGFEKLGTGRVGEPVFASPAVANGRLFIRGDTHLFCVEEK